MLIVVRILIDLWMITSNDRNLMIGYGEAVIAGRCTEVGTVLFRTRRNRLSVPRSRSFGDSFTVLPLR